MIDATGLLKTKKKGIAVIVGNARFEFIGELYEGCKSSLKVIKELEVSVDGLILS